MRLVGSIALLWLVLVPTLHGASEGAGAGPIAEPPNRSTEELWIEGHRAYEDGRYGAAAVYYQELIDHGFDGGWVQYDLGNARLRSGELGRAVAAFRSSAALLPRNGDVKANLTFARQSARDAITPPVPSVAMRTLFFWHFGLSRPELLNLLLASNLLFWALLALRLFVRRSEVLQWALIGVLIVVVAFGVSVSVRYLRPDRVAVVTASEIEAHSGTAEDTLVRFKLHAGSELKMVEEREGWLRVELPDAQQGWIESRYAEVVVH